MEGLVTGAAAQRFVLNPHRRSQVWGVGQGLIVTIQSNGHHGQNSTPAVHPNATGKRIAQKKPGAAAAANGPAGHRAATNNPTTNGAANRSARETPNGEGSAPIDTRAGVGGARGKGARVGGAGVGGGRGGAILQATEWQWMRAHLALSRRELEVVQHLFRGEGEARAAYLMNITISTVHTYIRRIYAKLEVHDQKELILHIVREYLEHFVRNGKAFTAEDAESAEEGGDLGSRESGPTVDD